MINTHRGGYPFANLMDFWANAQTELAQVTRFGGYLHAPDAKLYPVREQSTLAHIHAITTLAVMLSWKAKEILPTFDQMLLVAGVHFHDEGEGIVHAKNGEDILVYYKRESDDYAEYAAFMDRIKEVPKEFHAHLEQAFLLQFALNPPQSFPKHALEVMAYLVQEHYAECVCHRALELWDYLMYGFEQYHLNQNHKMLVHVLRRNIAEMNTLATKWDGISQIFWTDERRSWIEDFLSQYETQFLEVPQEARKDGSNT